MKRRRRLLRLVYRYCHAHRRFTRLSSLRGAVWLVRVS